MPLTEPPHGPFINPLEQRAMGQIPSNLSRIHSPHPAHLSDHIPCCSVAPKNLVLTPECTTTSGNNSTIYCTPTPHPSESTESASLILPVTVSSKNSLSHCRVMVCSVTSIFRSSLLAASRIWLARTPTSFSPPAIQTVTH